MTLNLYISEASARKLDGGSRLFHGRPQAAICIQPYFPVTGMDGGVAKARAKESGTVVVPRSKLPFN